MNILIIIVLILILIFVIKYCIRKKKPLKYRNRHVYENKY